MVIECGGVLVGESPYSLQVKDARALEVAIDNPAESRAPLDKVTMWERIAREDYTRDGDLDGWDSSCSDDEETSEEKFARENPNVAVITNLEDLYKVPRLLKAQREKDALEKAKKLKVLKAKYEAQEAAAKCVLGGERGEPTHDITGSTDYKGLTVAVEGMHDLGLASRSIADLD